MGRHALHAAWGGPRGEGLRGGPRAVRDAEVRVGGSLVGGEVSKAAGARGCLRQEGTRKNVILTCHFYYFNTAKLRGGGGREGKRDKYKLLFF